MNINFPSPCLLGSGDTNKGADPGDEPKLHRVQIPTDKSTPLDKGMFTLQDNINPNGSYPNIREWKYQN